MQKSCLHRKALNKSACADDSIGKNGRLSCWKRGAFMEMRVTGKRLGGAVKQTAPEKKPKAGVLSQGNKARQGRLELSKRAADFLTEQTKRMAEDLGRLGQEEKEESGGTSLYDHFKKQLDIMNKCAKISASISAGDRVPPEDLRYLKEHDINAYRLAMVTRKPKKDPKDKDSELSEEDIREMENGGADAHSPAEAISAAASQD